MVFIVLHWKNLQNVVNMYDFHYLPMRSNEHHIYLQGFLCFCGSDSLRWICLSLQITKPFPIDYQAFPYILRSLSLHITKPSPIYQQAFLYILPSLSLYITEPFPIDYQAFPYILPSLPLYITKPSLYITKPFPIYY